MYSFIHYKKIIFLFSSIVCCFIIGCKQTPKTEQVEIPLYETQEFQDFYQRFGKDSVFQMEHIVFPLEGLKSPTDSTIVDPDTFRWNADDWVLHGPYDDATDYSREFIAVGGIVFEKIADPTATFTMERRFAKLSSGWNLIYYRELGKYK